MSITKDKKGALITEFGKAETNTGSPEVQIAIWSERIKNLTEHMKANPKDFHSRRGLLSLVGKRRRMLDYLKRIAPDRYQSVIKALGLRR